MRTKSLTTRFGRQVLQLILRRYAVRENVRIGQNVHIGIGSTLWAPDDLSIADDVYIGKRCTIEVNGTIGSGTLIANSVAVIGRRDHDWRHIGTPIRHSPWVGDPAVRSNTSEHTVKIGTDCWLGYGAIILSGCSIGDGAIVAAGAIVTADVPPYAIASGIPARVQGWRFKADEIRSHRNEIDKWYGRSTS